MSEGKGEGKRGGRGELMEEQVRYKGVGKGETKKGKWEGRLKVSRDGKGQRNKRRNAER